MTKNRIFFLLIFFIAFASTSAIAQYEQTAKVVSNNRESRAEYGTAVAIDENFAVVGASRENIASGAAYVYKLNADGNWEFLQRFSAPDPNFGAEFGGGAKISQDHIVIAAGRANVDGVIRAGALYVYDFNGTTWDFSKKLVAEELADDAKLGMNPTSLAVENNIIVAGAPGENAWEGRVYIFQKIAGSWVEVQRLSSPNPDVNENFGIGVAVSENYLVVGANEEDNTKGAVHIFEKDGNGLWVYVKRIMASDAMPEAYFGSSVSVYDNSIAIGAYNDNGGIGATYVFEKDSNGDWVEESKITPSSPSTEGLFGFNCILKNEFLVVSAPHVYGLESAEVYVYSKDNNNNWNEIQKVLSNDLAPEDFYGWNIEMHENQLIVGAPWEDHDENGENEIDRAGSAYIFKDLSILGNNEVAIQNDLTIFPIPASEKVTFISNAEIDSIMVFNQLGAVVKQEKNINSSIYSLDLRKFVTGIYFAKVISNDGKIAVKKFIVTN
ncbi:T9SS type A sorting domain-containing protein [Aequorivita antarctica]|uniref:T9SS type A sorting domain-containing protein n=1 Tax=Aequorivita antarctica TaxID=153266 RepID=A0A5C6Z1D3_9FLAO|nr:T9SS type A sorting domain-containing protein [Aequorivita antarctica]TXD73277.1 T9SS type A sorting domain-containing protein [Aequorivita antarctica]SRX76030.1 hypothetical protein AEQU3_03028 [Aequorivita antarctica]